MGLIAHLVARRHLLPQEKLAWAGGPALRRAFPPGGVTIEFEKLLLNLFFCGLAIAVLVLLFTRFNTPFFRASPVFYVFPIFPLVFLGVGLRGLLSPIWPRLNVLLKVYAITDQRALVIDLRRSTVSAIEKTHLTEVRSRQTGSTGDVWFVGEASGASAARLEFIGVARVTEVEERAARML